MLYVHIIHGYWYWMYLNIIMHHIHGIKLDTKFKHISVQNTVWYPTLVFRIRTITQYEFAHLLYKYWVLRMDLITRKLVRNAYKPIRKAKQFKETFRLIRRDDVWINSLTAGISRLWVWLCLSRPKMNIMILAFLTMTNIRHFWVASNSR
jgi:hypothetical protein